METNEVAKHILKSCPTLSEFKAYLFGSSLFGNGGGNWLPVSGSLLSTWCGNCQDCCCGFFCGCCCGLGLLDLVSFSDAVTEAETEGEEGFPHPGGGLAIPGALLVLVVEAALAVLVGFPHPRGGLATLLEVGAAACFCVFFCSGL